MRRPVTTFCEWCFRFLCVGVLLEISGCTGSEQVRAPHSSGLGAGCDVVAQHDLEPSTPAHYELQIELTDLPVPDALAPVEAGAEDEGRHAIGTDIGPLEASRAAALLARVPGRLARPAPPDRLALRPGSPRPPRTGVRVELPFPRAAPSDSSAAPARPQPSGERLRVLRYAPEGEIDLAAGLMVTFSEPMVAITSHSGHREERPVVRLEPQPEGVWRWVGTRTLVFDPAPRFPMATTYRVTVPAGTRAVGGAVLPQEVSWTFATPAPSLIDHRPDAEPQGDRPLILLAFDQHIRPEDVLAVARLTAAGERVDLRLLDAAAVETEIEAAMDAAAARETRRWLDRFAPERVTAVRSQTPLPLDARVRFELSAGLASAEGPLRTRAEQGFDFHTYAPLRVERHGCGTSACRPLSPLPIEFNNPLDLGGGDPGELIAIEPHVDDLQVRASRNALYIRGRTRAQTRYRVTVAAALKDVFGQTLGKKVQLMFTVGRPSARLRMGVHDFAVLDPGVPPFMPVYTIGHRRLEIVCRAVSPGDWPRYRNLNRREDPPGQEVYKKSVEVPDDGLSAEELLINVKPAFDRARGNLVVLIKGSGDRRDYYQRAWLQRTDIGLSAHVENDSLLVWVTDLLTGRPLAGAEVELAWGSRTAVSDTGGLATLPLEATHDYLTVRKGDRAAMLPAGNGWKRSPELDRLAWYVVDDRGLYRPGDTVHVKGWLRRLVHGPRGDVAPVADGVDRVHYTVEASRGNEIATGEAQVDRFGGFTLVFDLPAEVNLGRAGIALKARGAESFEGEKHHHAFRVEEFRRPEFELTTLGAEGPVFQGSRTHVEVEARYYTGTPLPGAELTWRVSAVQGRYRPPGQARFDFGRWTPGWMIDAGSSFLERAGSETKTLETVTDAQGRRRLGIEIGDGPPLPMTLRAEASVQDLTRQTLSHSVQFLVHPCAYYVGIRRESHFVEWGESLRVVVIVTDLEGRAVSQREIELTAEHMAYRDRGGARGWIPDRRHIWTLTSADSAAGRAFLPDLSGRWRLRARVRDELGRETLTEVIRWVSGGHERPRSHRAQADKVEMIPDREAWAPGDTAHVLVRVPFAPCEALVTLRRQGILETRRLSLDTHTETIHVPIHDAHVPGLHLRVDVVGPVTRTDSNSAEAPKRFRGVGDRPADTTGVLVAADSIPARPAYAAGQLHLPVPPHSRTLQVEVSPAQETLLPGDSTRVGVHVRDAQGRPVPDAQVLLVAVDEALLALIGYRLDDPLRAFYRHWPSGVRDAHLRKHLLLLTRVEMIELFEALNHGVIGLGGLYFRSGRAGDVGYHVDGTPVTDGVHVLALRWGSAELSESIVMSLSEVSLSAGTIGSKGRYGSAGAGPIAVRSDFDPLACFAAALVTDADGAAIARFQLPDNLTRYRLTAVAVDGARRCGSGEANLTARLPLMVRPSFPRFLNLGDRCELCVQIQNRTTDGLTVEVAMRAANLALIGPAGRRVTVPAGDRREVRFPIQTEGPGDAWAEVVAAAGRWSDAARACVPVWVPATTEAFATYGTIDSGAVVQRVAAPQEAFPNYGGLEVTTSSTALQALTDAVLYFSTYRFDCSEQLASRILAVAALRDVLTAFAADGLPAPDALAARVQADIRGLEARQNRDGGFGLWSAADHVWPYVTVHAVHALTLAREKGFGVDQSTLYRARNYLRHIREHIPPFYSRRARWCVIAYALYVRQLLEDDDRRQARRLIEEADGIANLPRETLGWLLPVLHEGDDQDRDLVASIHRLILNSATETAATAEFATHYSDGAHLIFHGPRRTDAVLLEGLMATDPRNDLIPKVVCGLLAHRRRGHWSTTQENAWVLIALDGYFRRYESEEPRFVARAWLDEALVSEGSFAGRSTERHHLSIPMRALAGDLAPDVGPVHVGSDRHARELTLGKEGLGRLYYRVGMRYAPRELQLDPADHGFCLTRTYTAVDEPGDVWRDAQGAYHARAGCRVRVDVTMVAPARRYHVALVDPLPAGLEPLNPSLAGTGSVPPSQSGAPWDWRHWFEHQNLRDDRAEAFRSLLPGGVYTYAYVARATTPGRFIAPPSRAEEMYHPEIFGRGSTDLFIIE